MSQKTNNLLLICVFLSTYLSAQLKDYSYKSEIKGITDQWHRIILPENVFTEVKGSLEDIRVYGITENDTLEAPFILKAETSRSKNQPVSFKALNASHTNTAYSFTYEIANQQIINEIILDFDANNFDYKITLEGAQNLSEWVTIQENYRIIAIQNQHTDYAFTTLNFPNSSYKYYKINITTNEDPKLNEAKIFENQATTAIYNTFSVKDEKNIFDKKTKETTLTLTLKKATLISNVTLKIKDTIDYYRPITIAYALDSVKTEKGYHINYRNLFYGTLSSLEKNEFDFPNEKAKKIKITIAHQDNEPLEISEVSVKGLQHEIFVRFDKLANYYLTYGNENARMPNYDIRTLPNVLPKIVNTVQLGDPIANAKMETQETKPLFEDKKWLWGLMILIIGIIVWFTVGMIKKV
jgi:hypothetical protein